MSKREDEYFINRVIFKRYTLQKKLGEGSFGKIYIAKDVNTKELFAMKFVYI